MPDKILAVISLIMLIGFTMIVTVYVNELALWVVVLIVLIMAVYDFWREIFSKKNGNGSSS